MEKNVDRRDKEDENMEMKKYKVTRPLLKRRKIEQKTKVWKEKRL